MTTTTVRADITWDGKIAEVLRSANERSIKDSIKDMTGAIDVKIIEVNSWNEEDDWEDD